MKWTLAAATLAAAVITAGPIANAAPGNGNGNGAKPVPTPGQSISAVASSGAGPAAVITVIYGLKGPYSNGLPNALQRVTANHPAG